jgi:hypothetical protein
MSTNPWPFVLGSYLLGALVFVLEPLLAARRLARARRALAADDESGVDEQDLA